MYTNVEQELINVNKERKSKAKNNEVITEINRLLEHDNHRDVEIMSKLTPLSTAERAKTEAGKVIEIEKEENYYGGTVFDHQQIVTLADKYRLKFLPSQYYKSYMDITVPSAIKELERQIGESMTIERAKRENMTTEEYIEKNGAHKFEFDRSDLGNKFFILAPPSCFQLKEEGIIEKKVPDPILFYKTTDGKYRLVKKWGADFTIFRRALGFIFSTEKMFRFFSTGLPILTLTLIVALWVSTLATWPAWIIPSAIGSLIFCIAQFWADVEYKNSAFAKGGWATSDKVFGFYTS